jgi:hypothetical protein
VKGLAGGSEPELSVVVEARIGRGLPIPISKEHQQRLCPGVCVVGAPRTSLSYRPIAKNSRRCVSQRSVSERSSMTCCVSWRSVSRRFGTGAIRLSPIGLLPARVRKKSEILAELRRLVTDQSLSDEAFRTKANTLLNTDQPNIRHSRAADVREVLSRNARRIRPILQLLIKLDLQGDGDGGNGLSWLDGVHDDGIGTFFVEQSAGLGAALEAAHRGVGYPDERSRLRSGHRLGGAAGPAEWLPLFEVRIRFMRNLPATGCQPRFGRAVVTATNWGRL